VSWIRNHLRHFVLPGIHTLAKRQGRDNHAWGISSGSGLTAADIKPRDKQIRPSTKCKFVEAGMLYSLVSSILRKGDPTREIALGLCRQIGRAKDAEFVYAIDTRGGIKNLGAKYDGVEGSDVLHSMLCNSMRRLKRKMRRKGSLLLPGRDVWCWEVMARKLSVSSTFDPRVSRTVARSAPALRVCIDDWKIKSWDDVLFFDTGFSGTIPKAIARAEQLEQINMLLLSSGDVSKQIFRTHTGSRAKALAFEYLTKYFVSGTHRDGVPYQELAPLDEFIKTALLTIWLWHHISPTRLPSYRDKKIKRANPTLLANYTPLTINTSHFGATNISNDFVPVIGNDLLAVQPMTITSTATTAGPCYSTNSTASTTDVTLDQLWGAGATQQILVDQMLPPTPKSSQPPLTLGQQMQQEMDQAIINDLFVKAGGNLDKIPVQTTSWKKKKDKPKKIQPLCLNPETFELCDAVTGLSVEAEMDATALATFKGKKDPTEEGFGIGQYPGPPVVSAKKLKSMAWGSKPDGPIPDVSLSIEVDKKTGQVFKQTVFKTPFTG
jgi:hypothetical protein